jgi:cytidyltransferase-like protein
MGDLFHPGHVAPLREPRRHGDRLIVGVLPDQRLLEAAGSLPRTHQTAQRIPGTVLIQENECREIASLPILLDVQIIHKRIVLL